MLKWVTDEWRPRLISPLLAEGEGDDGQGAGGGASGDDGSGGNGAVAPASRGGGLRGRANPSGDTGDTAGEGGDNQSADGAGGDQGGGGRKDGDDASGDKTDGAAVPAVTLEEKPAYLNPQFYDAETGEVAIDKMQKVITDLRGKISKGGQKVPNDPDGYELQISKEMQPAADQVLAKNDEGHIDDPMLNSFRDAAHRLGIGQTLFSELTDWYITEAGKLVPEALDEKAELTKVGNGDEQRGQQILDHLAKEFRGLHKAGVFSDDMLDAMENMVFADASTIQTFMAWREYHGEQPIPMTISQLNAKPAMDAMREKQAKLDEDFASQKITEDVYNREMKKLVDAADKAA